MNNDLNVEISQYLKKLFPICRSITGNGNRKTLSILQEVIPLDIKEINSGTPVYDWIVPNEWNINDGWIADTDQNKLIRFDESNLHVVGYSVPIDKIVKWNELKEHLYFHSTLPSAIPYRTSYYDLNWGFCVNQFQYEALRKHGGPFHVQIDSSLKSGSMTYGELLIPGKSKQEILISSYICHPSMANDNLSGVLLATFLAKYLLSKGNHYWSYRFIFVPETIGAIAYCALNEEKMMRVLHGLVLSTVGGPGKYGYKQSWNHDDVINRLVEEVFKERGEEYITYPFDIHGSDERQYSSQKFKINTVTISRNKYYEYPEYHTSLDNLDFVTAEQIHSSLEIYLELIKKIENIELYKTNIQACEVMLSKYDLYPKMGELLYRTTMRGKCLSLI